MKAILLAGGTGSRMWPTTMAVNKHLLPVYNKPMIYYSLSVLLMCKFKEIFIICDQSSVNLYKKLLGNVADRSIYLEEYARGLIGEEEQHSLELKAMLKDFG